MPDSSPVTSTGRKRRASDVSGPHGKQRKPETSPFRSAGNRSQGRSEQAKPASNKSSTVQSPAAKNPVASSAKDKMGFARKKVQKNRWASNSVGQFGLQSTKAGELTSRGKILTYLLLIKQDILLSQGLCMQLHILDILWCCTISHQCDSMLLTKKRKHTGKS